MFNVICTAIVPATVYIQSSAEIAVLFSLVALGVAHVLPGVVASYRKFLSKPPEEPQSSEKPSVELVEDKKTQNELLLESIFAEPKRRIGLSPVEILHEKAIALKPQTDASWQITKLYGAFKHIYNNFSFYEI